VTRRDLGLESDIGSVEIDLPTDPAKPPNESGYGHQSE